MFWPMLQVALAFAGTAVLGVLAVRVGFEVRRLSRAVGDSAERISRAAEQLERSAAPLAARSGALRREVGGSAAEYRAGENGGRIRKE
ncbi:hypothetical protein [Streptomyces profundus]|uniref:hypothetical protein n=1 Tax=Streptomyces profundus TaxID=2867410 RepID=UPI001D16E867|nr:hypothetical protein [Streptomyces sp. MA3_2.13]UED83131.1 hypothetical protein K4G22_02065 [Streptomyces sp. MA3_2.13]